MAVESTNHTIDIRVQSETSETRYRSLVGIIFRRLASGWDEASSPCCCLQIADISFRRLGHSNHPTKGSEFHKRSQRYHVHCHPTSSICKLATHCILSHPTSLHSYPYASYVSCNATPSNSTTFQIPNQHCFW